MIWDLSQNNMEVGWFGEKMKVDLGEIQDIILAYVDNY